jgi:hypothetical protein
VQRTAILPGGDLGVGLLRARERVVLRERDDGAELRIEPLDAAQVDVRQPLGRELPRSIQRDSCVTGANAMTSSGSHASDCFSRA